MKPFWACRRRINWVNLVEGGDGMTSSAVMDNGSQIHGFHFDALLIIILKRNETLLFYNENNGCDKVVLSDSQETQ